jgi:SAM-dependent methyltransferase
MTQRIAVFPHSELRYYSFGLRVGFANLFTNGLSLGIKKSLGKITQPINSYTRFPEYYHFESAIQHYLRNAPVGRQIRVLDVGSPKMLGLYLAANTRVEVTLTDISELNIDEYRVMWRGLEKRAQGKAVFALQDARTLQYGDDEFDVVYSMSVIEHIEGDSGDTKAVEEMIRVLKPGGLLLVSVPFAVKYIEQHRVGFSGAVRETNDSRMYFFQRIYDKLAVETRILDHAGELAQIAMTTIWRRSTWMPRSFGALGVDVRGLLGFLNPLLSAIINRSRPGMDPSFNVTYGSLHTARDVYGDLILVGRKTQSD